VKLTSRHSWRTSLKLPLAVRRRIIAVVVAVEFVTLAVLAVEARVSHHGGSLIAVAVLLLGIVSGLNYLRSTGRRR
jgi:hypothetical protein